MSAALLFDLDGTLAITDPLHSRAWRDVLAEQGVELSAEGYDLHVRGRANDRIAAAWLPEASAESRTRLIADKEARFRAAAAELESPPGVFELLQRAQDAGVALAIVTSAPAANAHHVLSLLGLRERFEVIVASEDVQRHKPDPEPYQKALALLGADARSSLAFEDSPSGVCSALAAGLETVALLTGFEASLLSSAGANLCIEAFDDPRLLALLARRIPALMGTPSGATPPG